MSFRLHLGKPKHLGWLRFFQTRLSAAGYASADHFWAHPIRSMWGLSLGDRWFLGFMAFDRRETHRERVPSSSPSLEKFLADAKRNAEQDEAA